MTKPGIFKKKHCHFFFRNPKFFHCFRNVRKISSLGRSEAEKALLQCSTLLKTTIKIPKARANPPLLFQRRGKHQERLTWHVHMGCPVASFMRKCPQAAFMFTAVIHHPFLLLLIPEHPPHAVWQGEGGHCSSAKWMERVGSRSIFCSKKRRQAALEQTLSLSNSNSTTCPVGVSGKGGVVQIGQGKERFRD